VYRVDPATGKETLLADHLSRAYSVLVSDGQVLASSDNDIVRLEPAPREVVVTGPEQIGPIAAAPNGDLYFTAANTAFRVAKGSRTPVAIAQGLAVPHGIAVAADGAVLVSDTGHNRILRVDPSGQVTTFSEVERPGSIAVAADGSVYVCAALAERVVRFSADGTRVGFVGPTFRTPYGLATDDEGGLYVAEATEDGHIRRVTANGKVTTLSAG
jgi:sugar lactone lactonase YvrE